MEITTERPGPLGSAERGASSYPLRTRLGIHLRRASALLFLAPVLGLVGVFIAVPLIYSVRYSFTRWDGISSARWVGLSNYRFLYHSHDFHRILVNQLVLVCGIVLWVTLPMCIALLLHRQRGARPVRTILLIPILLPPVVVGVLFRLILTQNGFVNGSLRRIGLDFLTQPWLSGNFLVLFSVIGVIAWATLGIGVLFYSAGLSAIPSSFSEAAEVDGANQWQIAWYIYRPALRPLTRFWVLILTISTVTSFFPWIYSMTSGGPGVNSTTLDYEVFVTGIQNAQYGLGSAVAVVGLLFLALLIAIQVVLRRIHGVDG